MHFNRFFIIRHKQTFFRPKLHEETHNGNTDLIFSNFFRSD